MKEKNKIQCTDLSNKTNLILDKIKLYYKEKYINLTLEEKRKIFYDMIIESSVNQKFDNNAFYEILTIEEQKIANLIDYNEYFNNLMETFGYTKKADILMTEIFIDQVKRKISFNNMYHKEMILYKNILETYKTVAEELKLSSGLEISYYYTYLLWNGYFSITKHHEYNTNRLTILEFLSADVLHGGGVCLGYAALLNDFLKICQKDSLLATYYAPMKRGNLSFDYKPNIKTNIANIDFDRLKKLTTSLLYASGILRKLGNHAVNIINENGKQYVFDPTNLSVLNIDDGNKASLINGNGIFELKKYTLDFLNIDMSQRDLIYLIKSGNANSDLKRKDIIFGYENTLEIVEKNKLLLDSAYDFIHPSIEQIDSKILSMKKYSKYR